MEERERRRDTSTGTSNKEKREGIYKNTYRKKKKRRTRIKIIKETTWKATNGRLHWKKVIQDSRQN